jgi:hypothetical protein
MGQSKVAYRYAKALFDLALETGKVDQVHADLNTIQQANHKELSSLLVSPVIGGDKKTAICFSKHVFEIKSSPHTNFTNSPFNSGIKLFQFPTKPKFFVCSINLIRLSEYDLIISTVLSVEQSSEIINSQLA